MKRYLAVLLMLMLMLTALTACGKSSESLDLEAVYQALLDVQDAPEEEYVMLPEDTPEIIGYYYGGLSNIELKQQVLYMHPVTGAPTEVMLVEVANSEDVETVEDIFNARIAIGAADDFIPENAEGWENNAQVQTSGNYVALICMADCCTIPDNIFELK